VSAGPLSFYLHRCAGQHDSLAVLAEPPAPDSAQNRKCVVHLHAKARLGRFEAIELSSCQAWFRTTNTSLPGRVIHRSRLCRPMFADSLSYCHEIGEEMNGVNAKSNRTITRLGVEVSFLERRPSSAPARAKP